MPTLHRDYRPNNFSEILGQNNLKISLQNELAADRLSQAYIFCGPRAVGKTTMARILAKAANCLKIKSGEYEPCGRCQSCLSIKEGKNLDVVEIDAASNTGVDNVRDNVIAFARLAPSKSKYKVFIIDEVHMLSLSAFNALLKIIEEPPAKVIFIFCTTEIHKVPGTIISRCQRFDFKKIAGPEIVKKLQLIANQEGIEVAPEIFTAIAKESGGHLREAEVLLGQILALGDKSITLETAELVLPRSRSIEALNLLENIAKKESGQALSLINDLSEGGVDLKNFGEELILMLRKLLLNFSQIGLAEKLGLDFGDEIEKKIINLSKIMTPAKVLEFLRIILEALKEKNSVLPQLPLEMAIIELCLPENIQKRALSDSLEEPAPNIPISKKNTSPELKKERLTSSDSKNPGSLLSIDCQEIKNRWPEFLLKIKKYNHSLSFIMSNCQPQELEAGCLNLTFKYKFHYDRALDHSVRPIIEKTLAEVFGGPVVIKALLDENFEDLAPDKGDSSSTQPLLKGKKESGTIDNLIKKFGGQIAS